MLTGESDEDSWYCMQVIRTGQIAAWREKIRTRISPWIQRGMEARVVTSIDEQLKKIDGAAQDLAFMRREELRR